MLTCISSNISECVYNKELNGYSYLWVIVEGNLGKQSAKSLIMSWKYERQATGVSSTIQPCPMTPENTCSPSTRFSEMDPELPRKDSQALFVLVCVLLLISIPYESFLHEDCLEISEVKLIMLLWRNCVLDICFFCTLDSVPLSGMSCRVHAFPQGWAVPEEWVFQIWIILNTGGQIPPPCKLAEPKVEGDPFLHSALQSPTTDYGHEVPCWWPCWCLRGFTHWFGGTWAFNWECGDDIKCRSMRHFLSPT